VQFVGLPHFILSVSHGIWITLSLVSVSWPPVLDDSGTQTGFTVHEVYSYESGDRTGKDYRRDLLKGTILGSTKKNHEQMLVMAARPIA
jgi:hypothetical protein